MDDWNKRMQQWSERMQQWSERAQSGFPIGPAPAPPQPPEAAGLDFASFFNLFDTPVPPEKSHSPPATEPAADAASNDGDNSALRQMMRAALESLELVRATSASQHGQNAELSRAAEFAERVTAAQDAATSLLKAAGLAFLAGAPVGTFAAQPSAHAKEEIIESFVKAETAAIVLRAAVLELADLSIAAGDGLRAWRLVRSLSAHTTSATQPELRRYLRRAWPRAAEAVARSADGQLALDLVSDSDLVNGQGELLARICILAAAAEADRGESAAAIQHAVAAREAGLDGLELQSLVAKYSLPVWCGIPRKIAQFKESTPVHMVAISPDLASVAALAQDGGEVAIWSIASQVRLCGIGVLPDRDRSLALAIGFSSPVEIGVLRTWGDGKYFGADFYSVDARENHWDYHVKSLETTKSTTGHGLEIRSDSANVVAIFDALSKAKIAVLSHGGPIADFAISANGHRVVTAGVDGEIIVWGAGE